MSFRDLFRDRRRARALRAGRRRAAELEVLPSQFRLSPRAEAWVAQIEDELRWLERRIRNGTDWLAMPGTAGRACRRPSRPEALAMPGAGYAQPSRK